MLKTPNGIFIIGAPNVDLKEVWEILNLKNK
jgi:hypothetical protein